MKEQDNGYKKYASLLKTLGHPIRIKIIETLMNDKKSVGEIWNSLQLPQSTVSQHLSVLRGIGILKFERDGSSVRYYLSDKRIEKIIKTLRDNS